MIAIFHKKIKGKIRSIINEIDYNFKYFIAFETLIILQKGIIQVTNGLDFIIINKCMVYLRFWIEKRFVESKYFNFKLYYFCQD